MNEEASRRSLARRTQSYFLRGMIDGVLPIITNLGGKRAAVHHRKILYHEHAGVKMHLDIYGPETSGPHPVLVSYHGGGWSLGRRENLQRTGEYFARRGFVVFNCSYRLAPRHRLPAAVQDANCALRWVYEHAAEYDGDPARIGVWGDSAGGHLSAMMAVGQHSAFVQPDCDCAAPREVPVAAATHYYGVFDFARFKQLKFPLVDSIMRTVLGPRREEGELLEAISPVHLARTDRIPPTLVLCGTRDPLIGQSKRYARRLQELGGDVTLKTYRDATHGFLNTWWLAESKLAIRLAADHFSKHLGPVAGIR